jgi:regulatory protein
LSSDDPSADFDPDYASASADDDGPRRSKRRQPRKPRKITPEYLRRVALHYLDRYAATEGSLRAVLKRRIRKSATIHELDDDVPVWVDALIDDMKRLGFINDAAFAQTRAVSMHRSGKSSRAIRQTLAGKGISRDVLDEGLESAAEELGHGEDSRAMDRAAAFELARRKRLGAFNTDAAKRAERRDKDMAALARRGFGYDICRAVVEASDPDELADRFELS